MTRMPALVRVAAHFVVVGLAMCAVFALAFVGMFTAVHWVGRKTRKAMR